MRVIRRFKHHKPAELEYKINEQIRAPEVRLIDENGKFLNIVKIEEALKMAEEKELDLIEINPKAQPPIVKMLEYSKFKYIKDKEARQQKSKQKRIDTKGIRLSLRIGKHDIDLRKNQALQFLQEGNRVNVELFLKGRERQMANLAKEIVNNFIKSLEAEKSIKIEEPLSYQGGRLSVTMAPKNYEIKNAQSNSQTI